MPLKFEDLPPLIQEQFYDFVEEVVDGLLYCDRTWTAWEVGTMSADDFAFVADDYGFVSEKAEELWNFCVRINSSLLDGLEVPKVPLIEQEFQVSMDILQDGEAEPESLLWALSRLEDYGVFTSGCHLGARAPRHSVSGYSGQQFGMWRSSSGAGKRLILWSSGLRDHGLKFFSVSGLGRFLASQMPN